MKNLPVGTTGIAAYDINHMTCTIKKGTRVTITGVDHHKHSRGYDLTDEYGNHVEEIGFDCIIPDKQE